MRRKQKVILVFIILILLLGLNGNSASAQVGEGRYFRQTGHWVNSPFLEFYDLFPNPELIYGYPISEAYIDNTPGSTQGLEIQYFQKAVFEFHPHNPPGSQVIVTPLGDLFRVPSTQIIFPLSNPACRQAENWDYTICYSFLDYYLENGGEKRFGLPISNIELRGDRFVQYFEYIRMEWHPDYPGETKIRVANLGLAYFWLRGEDPKLLRPVENSIYTREVTELYIHGFVDRAMIPLNGAQAFNILVVDQNNVPVKGVQVIIEVLLPSGNIVKFLSTNTNDDGLAQASYQFEESTIGTATVTIKATFGKATKVFETSFRIWY